MNDQKRLRITEIFYSLQGESNTVGLPTVFIRLTGCPLRCVYCDTDYAFTGGQKMSLDAIIDKVKTYNTNYVTVTGGEPLSQTNVLPLMVQLADDGYQVSLETSGALDISGVDKRIIKVMDLKTPSSGELSRNQYQNINYLSAQDQIKFVIGTDADYEWSKKILVEYKLTARYQILFSNVADQMSSTALADKILHDQLPVRFQIQLHKYLWADAQGK
ncbi:MAG: 7-carboxy-7-deazaguanine synthase QueE [Methylococcales bacterium]|nr:7-carboxy-7-deazaguanine synthase QueE [Methylococcales bacterium]MCK5926533.1 7-carboxy-7-deazaguanine synthase QueE [Methylococcales bacterium]